MTAVLVGHFPSLTEKYVDVIPLPNCNGAFSDIYTARLATNREVKVALKRLTHPQSITVFREVAILKHLTHDNVVELLDVVEQITPPPVVFGDIFLVFELLNTNLQLHLSLLSKEFTIVNAKRIMFQILMGLQYLHSANVLHRDVKPANILLSVGADGREIIKLADFGQAKVMSRASIFRFIPSTTSPVSEIYASEISSELADSSICDDNVCGVNEDELTETEPCLQRQVSAKDAVTPFYGSPELLLRMDLDTQAEDMWGVGCVLAEVMAAVAPACSLVVPLFSCDSAQQVSILLLIANMYGGQIAAEDCAWITPDTRSTWMMAMRNAVKNKKKTAEENMKSFLKSLGIVYFEDPSNAAAFDLLRGLLHFNPAKRPTVDDAIKHNFFDDYEKQNNVDRVACLAAATCDRPINENVHIICENKLREDLISVMDAVLEASK